MNKKESVSILYCILKFTRQNKRDPTIKNILVNAPLHYLTLRERLFELAGESFVELYKTKNKYRVKLTDVGKRCVECVI